MRLKLARECGEPSDRCVDNAPSARTRPPRKGLICLFIRELEMEITARRSENQHAEQ